MLPRAHLIMLPLVVMLLAIAAVLALLSMLPSKWFEAAPKPPKPLAIELIEPWREALAQPTRGMSIGRAGFGTIVLAPERRVISSSLAVARKRTLPAEPPVAAQVAGLVRMFARLAPVQTSSELVVITLEEPPTHFGTIILRDGCLKVAEPGEPHVILAPDTKLFVDDEGFLTVGVLANGTATNPRLGEPAWWPGRTGLQMDAVALARVREKCGPGAARLIGPAQSVAASKAAADEIAARNLMNMYGLPKATALAKVRNCRARLASNSRSDPAKMIENPCGSTPPSPVTDPRSCPAGTNFAGGLCRTPAGHIRPLPTL